MGRRNLVEMSRRHLGANKIVSSSRTLQIEFIYDIQCLILFLQDAADVQPILSIINTKLSSQTEKYVSQYIIT